MLDRPLRLDGTWLDSTSLIAGVDEVGRGALFGPVVAAAVILPETALVTLAAAGVKDSKQLSNERRSHLETIIRQTALDCQIGMASVLEIERLNILHASLLAMRRAILRLRVQPHLCLVDGNQRVPNLPMSQETLVKGDQQSLPIACASIVAKVWRDRLLERLATKYPEYGLAANKGYGTAHHRAAIQRIGISRFHRKAFGLCRVVSDGMFFLSKQVVD